MIKIVILGAGFAGLQAANHLKIENAEIKIIDKNDYTVMLPAIPDVAGGFIEPDSVKYPIDKLIPENFIFIKDKITNINLEDRYVQSDIKKYHYDYLIICSGSTVNFYGFKDNLEKLYTLENFEDSIRIKKDFDFYLNQSQNPHVVFSGCGYTGIELALALKKHADKKSKKIKITMVERAKTVLPFLEEDERNYVLKQINNSGIEIITDSLVKKFTGEKVILKDDNAIENPFFIWTGGTKFSVDNITDKIEKLSDGRIIVNEYLQIPKFKEVFVAGDSAAIKDSNGNFIRKAVNFAYFSGKTAGKNINLLLNGSKLRKFKPFDAGWIIPMHNTALGRLFGKIKVKGTLPLRLHYFMCGFRNYKENRFKLIKKSITLLEEKPVKNMLLKFLFGNDGDSNFGLLILRVFTGVAMMTHGFPKLFQNLEGFTQNVANIGFPAPAFFAFMAAFSEFFGSLLLATGFMTRLWSFFIGFTMSVAVFVVHSSDAFSRKELALFYLIVSIFFLMKGAGKFSLDYMINKKLKK
ncbi:MAG: FAD-dependent oxidoreductase [Candidatus Muiribacteriota bacterium]